MIAIAQCTQQKQSRKCKAKEMYMPSDLFKAQRRYCEAYADEWYILSGKYGLISPTKFIKPYNQHISEQYSEWWQEQVQATIREFDQHVEIVAGKEDYGTRLEPYLKQCGLDYSYPFDGRIGTRTKRMIQEARKVENTGLDEYVTG